MTGNRGLFPVKLTFENRPALKCQRRLFLKLIHQWHNSNALPPSYKAKLSAILCARNWKTCFLNIIIFKQIMYSPNILRESMIYFLHYILSCRNLHYTSRTLWVVWVDSGNWSISGFIPLVSCEKLLHDTVFRWSPALKTGFLFKYVKKKF